MRLQLISDLHTEFYLRPLELSSSIEIAPDLDFLVIAGDLVVPGYQDVNQVHGVLDYFSKQARNVLYVEGNHEFYRGSRERVISALSAVMPQKITWLRNEAVELDGVKFFGGTMWYAQSADGLDRLWRGEVADWSEIRDLEMWVYNENLFFSEQAARYVTIDTVVVTHHLPHMNSVPKEYKKTESNRFFVCDQSRLIASRQPRLWLHGHTHQPCDYQLGATRVMCNPYAYPKERAKQGPYPLVVLDV